MAQDDTTKDLEKRIYAARLGGNDILDGQKLSELVKQAAQINGVQLLNKNIDDQVDLSDTEIGFDPSPH